MAKIVHRVVYHNCYKELAQLDISSIWLGSIAECSCGKRYILTENQKDGKYWNPLKVNEHDM